MISDSRLLGSLCLLVLSEFVGGPPWENGALQLEIQCPGYRERIQEFELLCYGFTVCLMLYLVRPWYIFFPTQFV